MHLAPYSLQLLEAFSCLQPLAPYSLQLLDAFCCQEAFGSLQPLAVGCLLLLGDINGRNNLQEYQTVTIGKNNLSRNWQELALILDSLELRPEGVRYYNSNSVLLVTVSYQKNLFFPIFRVLLVDRVLLNLGPNGEIR